MTVTQTDLGAAAGLHQAWLQKASVRRQGAMWTQSAEPFNWHFPSEMKPLLAHPELLAQPESVQKFVHVQSFHKYLHDVCLTETDVVNRVSTDIAYGRSATALPPDLAAAAFSIIVDEAFHSYVARVFSMHITQSTGIAPIEMPARNALVCAYDDVAHRRDAKMLAMSQLLCCCLSESTFTKEILAASRLEGYDPAFHSVMVDHLADEGRHYSYFRQVLTLYWERLDEEGRLQAASLLPEILATYFDDSLDEAFDRQALIRAGIDAATADRWIDELRGQVPALPDRPRVRNSIGFLKLCGLLQHPAVHQHLRDAGLLTDSEGV